MLRKGKLVNDNFGPSIEGPADQVVINAWEASTPSARIKLARKALSIDMNAIDAYNILGIHGETLAERIALFREAVIIGLRLFEPLVGNEEMVWWGFIGTRPWMRAQHNLGLALVEAGDNAEAVAVFKRLLDLNPNDNQGIRYLMLRLFAEAGDYDNCKILFGTYEDDGMIEFPATRLLVELSRAKLKKSLDNLLEDVRVANPFVLDLLKAAAVSGKWPKKSTPQYIEYQSKEQAASYVAEFKNAWLKHPRIFSNLLELLSRAR